MSQATQAEQFANLLAQYKPGTGRDRYVRFIEDILGYEATETLRKMAEALEQHEQTLAVGANGPGKSYSAALLGPAVLYTNAHCVVPITAGNGDTLKNSIWKPIQSIWRNSGLPGDIKKNDRSLHTSFDEEWFLECHSPRHPEDLEGDHNENVVFIIEEADKPGVTYEHIDSARSALGDDDHILVIANPPTDETNVVADLMDSPEWYQLQFPTWESRNAKIDRGLSTKDRIGGITGVKKMESDWREYHDDPWPGIERAIEVSSPYLTPEGEPTTRKWDAARKGDNSRVVGRESLHRGDVEPVDNPEFREDLHEKWYKRRAGVMPPEGSEKWRPWSISDVEQAWRRDAGQVRVTPEAFGLDVARSVDETVGIGLHGPEARVEYTSQDSHPVQRREVVELVGEWPTLPITVDAIGKGEPIAEELDSRYPDVRLFGNNQTAIDEKNYRYKWDEGLQLIGEWLRSGGSIDDQRLYEELKVAARVLQFEERTLASRGGKIIQATAKDELKDALGRSPDRLDALLMAVHAKETGKAITRRKGITTRKRNLNS